MTQKVNANDGIVWGSSISPQLERLLEQSFVRLLPRKPVRLPRFASTSLPDPSGEYEGCLIYCPDTKEFRGSDGTSWGVL